MIVWVLFIGGAGGDGFANLLEQSTNAVCIDQKVMWRIHRYVDYKPKFWAPNLQNKDERINGVWQLSEEQLVTARSTDQYLIITSHDVFLDEIFVNDSLPKKNHIKLLVTSNIIDTALNFKYKNLVIFNKNQVIKTTKKSNPVYGEMDFVVEIDRAVSDWEYVKTLTDKIGLDLPRESFEYYKKLISGSVYDKTPGIEYYESYEDIDNLIRYKKIK